MPSLTLQSGCLALLLLVSIGVQSIEGAEKSDGNVADHSSAAPSVRQVVGGNPLSNFIKTRANNVEGNQRSMNRGGPKVTAQLGDNGTEKQTQQTQADLANFVLSDKECGLREITETQTDTIVARLLTAVDENLKKMEANLLKEMDSKLLNLKTMQEKAADSSKFEELAATFATPPSFDDKEFEHKLESYMMRLDPIVAVIGITSTTLIIVAGLPVLIVLLKR